MKAREASHGLGDAEREPEAPRLPMVIRKELVLMLQALAGGWPGLVGLILVAIAALTLEGK